MSGDPHQQAYQRQYLAPSAQRHVSSSLSAASSPATTPTTPTFPVNRDLTPSPVPSTNSSVQSFGANPTQYRVKVNPAAGSRVSSRSRQSSKGPTVLGMPGLGYPGTVRGVKAAVDGTPGWHDGRGSVYQTPSHSTQPYQAVPPPLATSELPTRTVHLANPLARPGRAPPVSAAPVPMRGSHFITPSGVQPMFVSPPVAQPLPPRIGPNQREYHLPTAHQGRELTGGGARPRSSTSSSTASVRTVSQSQIGTNRALSNGESSNHVVTPRKPLGTTTSMASTSSSGSARLTSPPPPMPPPRDMPLPPLPPLPSNSSLSGVSAASSQASLRRTEERRTTTPVAEGRTSTSELRGLGLGPVSESLVRDPRPRDVSAPANMNGDPQQRYKPASGPSANGGTDESRAKARKMSSPPLGGLFSRMAGKSTTSLNSTSGSSGRVRMSDAPSEFGVLARGPSQQVERVPIAPPAASRSDARENDSAPPSGSLPTGKGKASIPSLGLGRPSMSYQGARRSEEFSRKLSSNDFNDPSKLVQPRKSSGGLKALFSRNKNKDRPSDRTSPALGPTLPQPTVPPLATKRRASEDMLRSRKIDPGPDRPLQAPAPLPLRRAAFSDTADVVPMDVRSLKSSQASSDTAPARSKTPHPPSSPTTPTATSAGSAPPSARTPSFEPPIQRLPPSVSLHLGDLPQLDLSLGSTFDDLLKSLELGTRMSPKSPKKVSPLSSVRPNMHSRRRSRSFSEFSHSSSGKSLLSKETTESIGRSSSRAGSSASLAADVAAYRALEVQPALTVKPSSMPALSLSDHERTLSGASSVSGQSPPRTPGSVEDNAVIIHHSVSSSSSAGPLNSDSKVDARQAQSSNALEKANPAVTLEKFKPARPSLLQMAQSQRSTTTILEQEETKTAENSIKLTNNLSALGLAPSAEILETSVPTVPKKEEKFRQIRLPRKSRKVQSQYTATELAAEMKRILVTFQKASAMKSSDKAGLIRSELLDCMVEGEKKGFDPSDERGNAALRSVSVEWLNVLLQELKIDQAANERGACLEALSTIMESPPLAAVALDRRPGDQAVFRSLMQNIMKYVLEKLSGKGVFHNTLMFAGRMLAFAFFRIEGIAAQLLSALPTKQAMLSRFLVAVEQFSPSTSPHLEVYYPSHLQALQLTDVRVYMSTLSNEVPAYNTEEEENAFHFKPGNWLRRWQSDDSELFPAFYKAYHRQLARYLTHAMEAAEEDNIPIPSAILTQAPGYAHLAAVFAVKCQSYINGAVNAVTTTSASSSFTADESAGMRGNVKPPILETANRRLSELILHLASSKLFVPSTSGAVQECDGIQFWANMIDVWTKYLISRTSLYSPKAVFCLFDLLDGIMMPPSPQLMSPDVSQHGRLALIDIPYLITIVRIILTETEHHLTLAKCIAFVWTHFDTLCHRVEDRQALCLQLLLDPVVFERLMLFWSQSVRSYVLRLVVFRLGHLSTSASDFVNHGAEVNVVQLLNASLERIRRRHDELEPKRDQGAIKEDPGASNFQQEGPQRGLVRSRSTITMVEMTEPYTAEQEATQAEQLLGLAPSSPVKEGLNDDSEIMSTKAKGKSANWFKKPFSKTKKSKKPSADDSDSDSTSSGRRSLEGPAPGQPKSILKSAAQGSSVNASKTISTAKSSSTAPRNPIQSKVPASRGEDAEQTSSHAPKSPRQQTFEFELPTASPRSDTFDRAPIPGSPSRLGVDGTSNPPKLPASPHMSRSFSKRSSLLHPAAASVIDGPTGSFTRTPLLSVLNQRPPYDKRLHPYCIRMLAELEDVRREYDEWWAEDGPGRQDNAPPRLNVAWPFSEDED